MEKSSATACADQLRCRFSRNTWALYPDVDLPTRTGCIQFERLWQCRTEGNQVLNSPRTKQLRNLWRGLLRKRRCLAFHESYSRTPLLSHSPDVPGKNRLNHPSEFRHGNLAVQPPAFVQELAELYQLPAVRAEEFRAFRGSEIHIRIGRTQVFA